MVVMSHQYCSLVLKRQSEVLQWFAQLSLVVVRHLSSLQTAWEIGQVRLFRLLVALKSNVSVLFCSNKPFQAYICPVPQGTGPFYFVLHQSSRGQFSIRAVPLILGLLQ